MYGQNRAIHYQGFINVNLTFVIKELAEESEGQFECLGQNEKRYITFPVPIKEELDNSKTVTFKIKFIDSFRFILSSLSSLADNVSEGIHSDKFTGCKSCLTSLLPDEKNWEFQKQMY